MAPLLGIFFLSGVAALIYEVLWLKELGLVFGVTTYAAATTLAVFFLGLSAGSWVWGKRAATMGRPLRTYALLEFGIAASAGLYFWLLDLYRWLFPSLFSAFGSRPNLLLAAKFLLAAGILFLPAFFMGGTLPVMAQYLIRSANELGRKASVLYAVSTLGAAVGAFIAGFYLPVALGFRKSCLLAMSLNLAVGLIALWWSRSAGASEVADPGSRSLVTEEAREGGVGLDWRSIGFLAIASGFLTLALEVLWTRMFAQVLQNSVYTFAVILTIFLIALALGSLVSHLLCRLGTPPVLTLAALLTLSGLTVALSPLAFYRTTSGLQMLGQNLPWSSYVLSVFWAATQVLLLPGIAIGSAFPYLMKLAEKHSTASGSTVGRLSAVNTLAAIAGSVVAGFLLLEWIGLWGSLRLIAALYLLLALVGLKSRTGWRWLWAGLSVLGLVGLATSSTFGEFALVGLDHGAGEELVAIKEGGHGTVAVVKRGEDLRLKVNNSYLLGTSMSTPNLRLQAWVPLSLHPNPRSVFFLGMGTGITAGGALDFPVESVRVLELNPDVIQASRDHFGPFLNGLFTDPRVEIFAEDGRTFLAGVEDRYDVIIADIFLTYKAGSGSLYAREHFETVRSRLAPGGLFAQWLPMFELSQAEFGIITRTMLEVFPRLTLWRRGFSPKFSVYALVGHNEQIAMNRETVLGHVRALGERGRGPERLWFFGIPFSAYSGNIVQARGLFDAYPISTEDKPVIEYLSPISSQNHWAGRGEGVLVWNELTDLLAALLHEVPPGRDPYLEGLGSAELQQVYQGLEVVESEVLRRTGALAQIE